MPYLALQQPTVHIVWIVPFVRPYMQYCTVQYCTVTVLTPTYTYGTVLDCPTSTPWSYCTFCNESPLHTVPYVRG